MDLYKHGMLMNINDVFYNSSLCYDLCIYKYAGLIKKFGQLYINNWGDKSKLCSLREIISTRFDNLIVFFY